MMTAKQRAAAEALLKMAEANSHPFPLNRWAAWHDFAVAQRAALDEDDQARLKADQELAFGRQMAEQSSPGPMEDK